MDLGTIEQNVGALEVEQGFDLIYDLLAAYGMPKASIARLKKGTLNKSDRRNEQLWKGKVYYRFLDDQETDLDLHAVIDDAASADRITKERPRFLIVRDRERLVAVDRITGETLDVPLEKLRLNAAFFLPWTGIEKTQLDTVHYADIKAAEKMARLYDEIRRINEPSGAEELHALNVFFSRLLFCFFAEDTGIFEKGQLTEAIGSLTRADGDDLHEFLEKLFEVLDTEAPNRGELPSYLRDFGYVNGSLFSHRTTIPRFSAKARSIILECGELDWSQINPDIFGSMMQAVVHPDQRAGLGMHYTSVENIMKVLRPLFLDGLDDAYRAAEDDPRKLRRLLDRLCAIKIFDPACGSGNFLVIAYKEIRKREHQILQRLREIDIDPLGTGLFKVSGVKLENFYGIEKDDFAHEVAMLALWLAKHQMNTEFEELFGSQILLIPLTDAGNVICANAIRVDWDEVCPSGASVETYLCGNPPYVGSSMQTKQQKDDIREWFGTASYPKKMDYVGLWFLKGAQYVRRNNCQLAFVATNSLTQGDHVGMVFPSLYEAGVEIAFAHKSFRWSNSARANAGVTCVVIGLAPKSTKSKRLFSGQTYVDVPNIGPYLIPMARNTIVRRVSRGISGLPRMVSGNKPSDGGNLVLTPLDREKLISDAPTAEQFVKKYVGSDEHMGGETRYCLWIDDARLAEATAISEIRDRIERVRKFRLASTEPSTCAMANRPHRFYFSCYDETRSIIVPSTTSERREYVPIGFLDDQTVISNLANAISDAEPWLFGLIQSRMHMAWLRAVGGRLETRYRYSAVLVYNTFPVPDLTDTDKQRLTQDAFRVLAAREQFPGKTLADLYDPEKMPDVLREAHRKFDETVDLIYDKRGFTSDDNRLATLFQMYERMIASEQEALRA
jgi:hypothetical protein